MGIIDPRSPAILSAYKDNGRKITAFELQYGSTVQEQIFNMGLKSNEADIVQKRQPFFISCVATIREFFADLAF